MVGTPGRCSLRIARDILKLLLDQEVIALDNELCLSLGIPIECKVPLRT